MPDPKAPVKAAEAIPEVKAAVNLSVSPMKVRLHEKLRAIPKEDLEQVSVWYGTKKECPFVNYGVGGLCFPAMICQTRIGSHGGPDTVVPMDGNFHKMTKVRIDEVMEAVGRNIFRNIGGRVEQWDVEHRDYVQDASDVPVGRYLYMIVVKDGAPFDRSSGNAQSMA
jgi:hypothetical protein